MTNKYCNLDGSKKIKDEFNKITDGFGKVEEDVKNIIVTPAEGVSEQEIIQARKGKGTLSDRLNETDTNINTVDSKVNTVKNNLDSRIDNIIATPTTVSQQEIIDARQDKTSLGANLTSIKNDLVAHKEDYATLEGIIDGSVTPSKTSFLDFKGSGKNKFNLGVVQIIKDKQPSEGLVGAALGAVSFLFPCKPNTAYTISKQLTGTRFQAGYTDSDTLVSGATPVYNYTINNTGNSITLPKNPNANYIFCYFWRVVDQGTYVEGDEDDFQFQIEEGHIQTEYEPYKEIFNLLNEYLPEVNPEKMLIINSVPEKNIFGGKELLILKNTAFSNAAYLGQGGVSFLMPCKPNTAYTISRQVLGTRFQAGYTDTNTIEIGTPVYNYTINNTGNSITLMPHESSKYIICYFWREEDQGIYVDGEIDNIQFQIEEGYTLTEYEPYKEVLKIKEDYLPQQKESVTELLYDLKLSAIPDSTRDSLITDKDIYPTLFAIKTSNARVGHPTPIGWLYYVDKEPFEILYADKSPENMRKLFTWKKEITWNGTSTPKNYSPFITKDGDIIFVYRGEQATTGGTGRQNPIVYPAGDYDNPIVVDLGTGIKPTSWLQNSGADYIYNQDCFIFGEYTRPVHDMVYTWKVTKPFTNPKNWRIVNEYVMDLQTGARHFHTTNFDPYTEIVYSTTGDSDGASRVLYSLDYGETWTVLISGSETYGRMLNFVITKDKLYWSTDSQDTVHHLFVANKDENGLLNIDTTTILYTFPTREAATYTVALIDNPNGLLILNRFDYVSTVPLKVYFWSFEDNRMHVIKEIEPVDYTKVFGFRCESVNFYQSPFEKRIICGFGYFANNMKVFGNTVDDMVGNLALEVVRK